MDNDKVPNYTSINPHSVESEYIVGNVYVCSGISPCGP